ncbi:hypothetical protein AALP_AAs69811U000200 [Arabis alpina]|uniref:Endonuclease/exonuclease/phosphatase domain-containing protein n=1 Tax=Arabis alpina TaxID=50452 RepID=A0A087FXC1_ARAAL|nr:hypothetical protein AALP_AAs69811U000200 [Arabis alpina]
MKLVHAPIWVLFKHVPPELWSFVGFSTIASGVGIPIHSEFPKLSPYSNGVVKLKVVVELEKNHPSSVIVKDTQGTSVMVSAEYPKLPPRCGLCKEFGHLDLRCPSPHSFVRVTPCVQQEVHVVSPDHVLSPMLDEIGANFKVPSPALELCLPVLPAPDAPSASGLVTSNLEPGDISSSGGWLHVVKRSKPPSLSGSVPLSVIPVTSARFDEEAELINAAQVIIRKRIAALEVQPPSFVTASVRKKARRKLRQQLLLLSASEADFNAASGSLSNSLSTSATSVNKEQLQPQSVPPFLSVVVYIKTAQMMLCGVLNLTTNKAFTVAFIYARNRRLERVPLWNSLKDLAASPTMHNRPWLVMGDFNQVISLSEVYSLLPSTVCMQRMDDFQDCLSSTGLFDLAPRGNFFTWTNNSPDNPKARKLDRALVNEKWQEEFPDSNAFFDVPGDSDHSPILVTLTNALGTRKSRFNFFSFFTSHPEYIELMDAAWNCSIIASSPMFNLYQRLRSAKCCCKGLNRRSFSNIQSRTKLALEKLENIQRQVLLFPSQSLFQEERAARDNWLLFALAEESFFHQKSRIRWLSLGDANSRFFHRSVLANLSRNIIHFLRDNLGSKVTEPLLMKGMVIQFFSELLGTVNDSVRPYSVSQFQTIHPFRCDSSLAL